jgi:hypothetical protein
MEANNNFTGGQNPDISKVFQKSNEYIQALNFRPITEKGGSNASLVNIKGNDFQIEFPVLRGVYKLKIVPTASTSSTESLTINGQTTTVFTVDENTTGEDIYSEIVSLSNCIKNVGAINPTFDVAYFGDEIVIYQLTTFVTGGTTNSTEPLVIINHITGGVSDSRLYYVDNTSTTTLSYTPFVPAIGTDTLTIIGSTFINEVNYLLTCPTINSIGTGQIWEMYYNELNKTTTLILLYNSLLGLSKDYPVAPSAFIGRYELAQIQRIYWTDYNNPVRSVNTKDVNLMAFDPELVNLIPSVQMSVPVLNRIIDGGAVAPIYTKATFQCAYRLVKNNGAISNFSNISNIVTVTPQATSNFTKTLLNYSSLSGNAQHINKAIKWEVDGIDTDFDTIEFYVIIRTSPAINTFTIYKFNTQLINGNTKISATYINDQPNQVEITIDEFLLENTIFTHCKTLEQKDNRLFFGNVKNNINSQLDSYDARAFRFLNSSNDIKIKKYNTDTTVTTVPINSVPGDYLNIDEATDAVPLINLGMSTAQDPLYNPNIKYKRNSTILGGEGANISYSFGNLLLRTDQIYNEPFPLTGLNNGTVRDLSVPPVYYNHGFRRASGQFFGYTDLVPNYSNNSPFQTYYQNDSIQSMAMEYLSGLLRTYQHNEIYRFGILFKSRTGESSFVKWIGDIKFPDYSDLADPALRGLIDGGASCQDFRSLFIDPNGTGAYSVLPYIKFNVNIPPGLASTISGYEIVRCHRNTIDKTISSHGLVTQVSEGWSGVDCYLPGTHYLSSNNLDACDPSFFAFEGRATPYMVAYHSFDSLVDKPSGGVFEDDDELILTECYQKNVDVALIPGNTNIPNANERYYIKKYYNKHPQNLNTQSVFKSIYKISEGYYVAQGVSSPTISTTTGVYRNIDYALSPSNHNAYSEGSPTVILGIKTGDFFWQYYGNWNVFSTPSTQGNAKLLALHFKPSRLNNQYGGNSYIQRANSEYITTGAFYPTQSAGLTSIEVFGGDIFHGILDIQKAIKKFAGPNPDGPWANEKHSQTWFFPHQSCYNIDLRVGIQANKDLFEDTNNPASASSTDSYDCSDSYSYPNNIKTYISKPIFFNQTDTWVNRVHWSDVKLNGENADSWANVPALNYYDVEGGYGPINALIMLGNNMYFLQDRAIGTLIINPVSLINDNNGLPLKLGTGSGVLEKHINASIDAGTKYQWSVYRSSSDITFVDTRHKKIYLFDGQTLNCISDSKNNRSVLNNLLHDNILVNDNPIIGKGVLTTYDYRNNEFLYTFLNIDNDAELIPDERNTLVYSSITNKFTGFYSFTPYIYINNNNRLYSPKEVTNTNRGKLYLHNEGNYCEFYDVVYPSSLKFNVNDNPIKTKIFDNLAWITDSSKDEVLGVSPEIPFADDTFQTIRCYNDYQNTDYITLTPTNPISNIRFTEQSWNVQIPRNKVNYDVFPINTYSIFDPTVLTKLTFGERMRDQFMIIDLSYNNALNNRFVVSNVNTTYRISDR